MINSDNRTLQPNQKKAIEAMLLGLTKGQAAVAAGVQPVTLSRWLQQDDFRATLDNLSDYAVKDAAIRLKSNLDTAVDVFRDTMTDDDMKPEVKLRAADMVATHALRLVELASMLERIEALEARL